VDNTVFAKSAAAAGGVLCVLGAGSGWRAHLAGATSMISFDSASDSDSDSDSDADSDADLRARLLEPGADAAAEASSDLRLRTRTDMGEGGTWVGDGWSDAVEMERGRDEHTTGFRRPPRGAA